MNITRKDGRADDAMRPVRIERGYAKFAAGSALIDVGDTRVLCAVSIEERVPRFVQLEGGGGWITAEYAMLPGSTPERSSRDGRQGSVSGRTQEIQRLIGRSIRAVVDTSLLGERTFWLDCDVLQADGGTRCASITGAFAAFMDACEKLRGQGDFRDGFPVKDYIAAVSVGVVNGKPVLDLPYKEDSAAEVDMNVVMTGSGAFVEIQGSAEAAPFTRRQMNEMLNLAAKGNRRLIDMQRKMFLENANAVHSGDLQPA